MSRDSHALAILGPILHARLAHLRVLVVGSGGIGCELLKNLVLSGFAHITLLDLDTIDLSNLNRQFLFRKIDVKRSKSLVAARTAAPFNPNVKILPIHANIKDPQFDVTWFMSFDIVLNALDNLDARRHVNKMCMAANVPLVESGTAGYYGQVQPIIKDQTECFDCLPKPTPKSFPVCTIRSTPSQPIHCIVWAKSYLFPQLFGQDEDDQGELDDAEKHGENATEIQNLRREAQAFKAVRVLLRAGGDISGAARRVFDKVFMDDVKKLLSMADMWRSRAPPVPLDFDDIASTETANDASDSGLRDQKVITPRAALDMFLASTSRLAARLAAGEDTLSFDKDDDDALDFVCAAANLRSVVYGIPGKTRWEVKEMAGNIIPAIATTNAVIAGLIVLQALHVLRATTSRAPTPSSELPVSLRTVHLQHKPAIPLQPTRPEPPNPACSVCRDTFVALRCDPARTTLAVLVDAVLDAACGTERPSEVSVYENARVLADPDFDDNATRTLADLGCGQGTFVTIVDEADVWGTLAIAVGLLPEGHPLDGLPFVLPTPMPIPPRKTRAETPVSPAPHAGIKRSAPEDDADVDERAAKRTKTQANGSSPSKGYREVEGVLIVEDGDDDVILID